MVSGNIGGSTADRSVSATPWYRPRSVSSGSMPISARSSGEGRFWTEMTMFSRYSLSTPGILPIARVATASNSSWVSFIMHARPCDPPIYDGRYVRSSHTSEAGAFQPERVRHHAEGAERHGRGGEHRVQQSHRGDRDPDRKSTRLNSSHGYISYAVFCFKK